MAEDQMAQLKAALGGQDLDELSALGEDQQKALLALIEAAQRQQGEELQKASEEALSHVPALLRGAVRRLLLK